MPDDPTTSLSTHSDERLGRRWSVVPHVANEPKNVLSRQAGSADALPRTERLTHDVLGSSEFFFPVYCVDKVNWKQASVENKARPEQLDSRALAMRHIRACLAFAWNSRKPFRGANEKRAMSVQHERSIRSRLTFSFGSCSQLAAAQRQDLEDLARTRLPNGSDEWPSKLDAFEANADGRVQQPRRSEERHPPPNDDPSDKVHQQEHRKDRYHQRQLGDSESNVANVDKVFATRKGLFRVLNAFEELRNSFWVEKEVEVRGPEVLVDVDQR